MDADAAAADRRRIARLRASFTTEHAYAQGWIDYDPFRQPPWALTHLGRQVADTLLGET